MDEYEADSPSDLVGHIAKMTVKTYQPPKNYHTLGNPDVSQALAAIPYLP